LNAIVIDENDEYADFLLGFIDENTFEEVVIKSADGEFQINDLSDEGAEVYENVYGDDEFN